MSRQGTKELYSSPEMEDRAGGGGVFRLAGKRRRGWALVILRNGATAESGVDFQDGRGLQSYAYFPGRKSH